MHSAEEDRLAALADYAILDTGEDEVFDCLTRVAAALLDAPISLVSLIDRQRQWFKSHHGLELRETPRAHSFCAHAVADRAPLVVDDARADARFADNPLVTGDPGIRFYAGVPLITPDGHALGTLCVIDRKSRQVAPERMALLQELARQTGSLLEMHRKISQFAAGLDEAARRQQRSRLLASMIVHDLRNPLLGIVLAAASELDGAAGDTSAMRGILNTANRMQQQLNDILDVSLSEAGEVHPRTAEVDLAALLRNLHQSFYSRAGARGCRLELIVPEQAVVAKVDRDQVERLIANLLDNAIKFSPSHESIELALAPARGAVTISVSDLGETIPPAHRESIFDPFTHSDDIAMGGYGLGLAFCRIAAEAHRGSIRVEPLSPRGNRFVVILGAG